MRVILFAIALILPAWTQEKPRLFVLTDIANEPDDEESLVRLLVYSNEFEIEGLVATTSCWLKQSPREDLIRRQLDAYDKVHGNLRIHASGYPSAEALRQVTCTGQKDYGLADSGENKASDGSRLLRVAAGKNDPRPLWVTVWGGGNTLAQMLTDARRECSAEELARLVSKLRVYSISDQDDAGPWLRREFPQLFWIVSPSNPDAMKYHESTWSGISGDRHSKTGVFHHFDMVDNPWLEKNVIHGHGPLGALYPKLAYLMEGDTPCWLGLIDNGLGWSESPGYGGWGGRYQFYRPSGEARTIWTNNRDSRDTVTAQDGKSYTSDQATIWRWREHFQNDFAARMDWCIADDFKKANHNPVAVLNGDKTKGILRISSKPGETVDLSAKGSGDPDGSPVSAKWWIYPEAGTMKGSVALSESTGLTTSLKLPDDAKGELHVILQLEDNGEPRLVSYRRAIIRVLP